MQPIDSDVFFGLQYKDFIMTAAVILGPILAVQAQKFLEQFREKKRRRLEIFRTLMSTRAEILHRNHVQALNMIDIEFYGWMIPIIKTRYQSPQEQAVTHAWKIYNSHLNKFGEYKDESHWITKRQELLTELLYTMALALNYDFDKVQLLRDCYRPEAYNNLESLQAGILLSLAEVLKGDRSIPMRIVEWPSASETTAETKSSEPHQKAEEVDIQDNSTGS
ncbi:TPA: hypothetical protein PXN54_000237 [Yersinia enterocolitica]|nr:hypothetical protein [Yersinia enterocolitica]